MNMQYPIEIEVREWGATIEANGRRFVLRRDGDRWLFGEGVAEKFIGGGRMRINTALVRAMNAIHMILGGAP